jgi:hypothetical protein
MEVLTQRALNRALLARQSLLERADAPLPEALERVGGLQAQYAPSMYVGLWSRVAGFARDDLTRALERREVIQATLMRVTIHLVSRADFWPLALATRAARRQLWLRGQRGLTGEQELEAAAAVLRARLATEGPMLRKDIAALVGKDLVGGVGQCVDLVRAPPLGTWERRRADLYALAEDWVCTPPALSEQAALKHVLRRYLGAFGPASLAQAADWAGLQAPALAPAAEALAVRRFRAEDGTELLDLPGAPLPDPATPAPVRFLPTWDATLLVHARRTAILPEEHRTKVFHVKNPQSVPTFLVDGQVAGAWRSEGGRIALAPFHRLDAATRRALDAEAERLAAFHA